MQIAVAQTVARSPPDVTGRQWSSDERCWSDTDTRCAFVRSILVATRTSLLRAEGPFDAQRTCAAQLGPPVLATGLEVCERQSSSHPAAGCAAGIGHDR
jgi:hypothetical protein